MTVHRALRSEIRRHVELPCQVVRESDFALVADHTLNLSPDGVLVRSDAAVRVGETLIVSFQAAPLGLWIDAEATVVRVVAGRRRGDRGRAVALRFATLDRVKRFVLRGLFKRRPPPIPARERDASVALTRPWATAFAH